MFGDFLWFDVFVVEDNTAQEEAARIATEEAEAAAVQQFPLEWQGAVDALIQMGFAQSVAEDTVKSTEGDLEAALEAALVYVPSLPAEAVVTAPAWNSDWDTLLMELIDMGFENEDANKAAVVAHKGNLKSTVTALVAQERANRCSSMMSSQ